MHAAADLLEEEKDKLARTITLEMGKLPSASVEEIAKCGERVAFMRTTPRICWPTKLFTDATRAMCASADRTVLAIMPWNFPFWQVFRFAAPTLMAGNVALLKHAANVPQCALAIEEIFWRAGFGEGVFQTFLIETEQTRDDDRRSARESGDLNRKRTRRRAVASTAAKQIKKSVLELGGSDPFIVMPSADLEAAVTTGVKSRTINTGQSCIAAKRFIVAEKSTTPLSSILSSK